MIQPLKFLTLEQKITCYENTLGFISRDPGLAICPILFEETAAIIGKNEAFKHQICNTFVRSVFPELIEYRPLLPHSIYWFPANYVGQTKRIKIINAILEELNNENTRNKQ